MTAETDKKFYITTPIYYANGSPHIGHFLTTSVADALARYYRKKLGNENVLFTTGLDEHGTNVEQSAEKLGYKDLQEYVDHRAVEWQEAFDKTNISYDYFVRTTHPAHKQFAQDLISKMVEKGDVYKHKYKGKYCNGCEKFLTLSDLTEEGFCPLHRPDQVVEIEEENYFFKLSEHAPKVKQLIEDGSITIYPDNKRQEILSRLGTEINDLSISRPKEKVGWGVEFPRDDGQTVYVWVEALINYMSSLHIENKTEFWPFAVHALGKDINWFHTVIWPAFLISAGYEPFKTAFVHSFLNVSGQKISKSLGNIITPAELLEKYGSDGARYLILSNLPYKDDTDVTWSALDEKYNADLANGLGNTVARLTRLAERSGHEFKINDTSEGIWEDPVFEPIKEFRVERVLQNIWQRLTKLDGHINENEPWGITDGERLKSVLEYEINELYIIAVLLEPFLPESSLYLQETLKQKTITKGKNLFQRI